MEPAGVAIGVVGLVGLFNTCLETVAKIDAYREFGLDSRSLTAQFHANKLLFERWGRAIGLDQGKLSSCYHPGLDDQSVRSVVAELISMIQDICSDAGDGSHQHAPEDTITSKSFNLTRPRAIPSTSPASKRQKLAWALRGKEKRIAEVGKLDILVQKLYELVPVESEESKKVIESNGANIHPFWDLQDGMAEAGSWVKEIQETLKQIEQDIEAETRRELHTWIGGDIPSDLYHDLKATRVPGTCNWILERDEFRKWLVSNENSSVLWVNAIAGFGKTVMCARVIEHLSETMTSPVAHFFLSSKNASRDDPYLAIRSWIVQVMAHNDHAFNLVRMKRISQHEQIANRTTIVFLFQEIVKKIPDCTFVLDGLDECTWVNVHHQKHDSIKTFLQVIGEAIEESTSRLMVVSRNDESIRHGLRDTLAKGFSEIRMMVDDVYDDIVSYSKSIVNERLPNKPQGLRDDISQRMANQCDGQFLWVRLQGKKLRKVSNKFQLQKDISNAPIGLEQLYEREWESIRTNPDIDTERALHLLKWAAFSIRPLSVSEITVAVLIKSGCAGVPVEELPDANDGPYITEDIKAHCGSLLEITTEDKNEHDMGLMVVNITHFSVKQFILSSLLTPGTSLELNSALSASYEQYQHGILAEACLQYVFHLDVWKMNALPKEEQGLGIAFLDYAASCWYTHVCRGSENNTEILELTNRFFDDQSGVFDEWRRWINIRSYGQGILSSIPDEEDQVNRLSYAISLLLRKATEHLLAQGDWDVNGKGFCGETPLSASCRTGQIETINRLLSFGARISLPGLDGQMPLCIAADQGHIDVARVLLEAGADIDIKDGEEIGRTPLIWASSHGHLDLVKLLLESGADICVADSLGSTPLLTAVQEGHLQVTQLLLDKGANVNASSNDDRGTALHRAAAGGHLEVAKVLLDKGAEINYFAKAKMSPICCAISRGHLEMTELLIRRGADLAILQFGGASTLLHVAARHGYLEIVRLLSEKQKNLILAPDDAGDSPLIRAIYDGYLEVVRFLLEKEPTLISAANNQGWTPLHLAAAYGYLEICQFLLEKEADLSSRNSSGFTPLHVAAAYGYLNIVRFLLEKGADLAITNNDGWVPLHLAASQGHLEIVRLLLEKGANPAITNNDGWVPLHLAASHGYLDIVRLLLEKGADLAITNNDGCVPLHLAASHGDLEIVRLLLEKGAGLNVAGKDGITPLHLACYNGNAELVSFLLEQPDINADAISHWGRSPLSEAARCGHVEVVKALVCGKVDTRVDAKDRFGLIPLFCALRNGHTEAVEVLLPKTPGWNEWKDSLGRNLTWWAHHLGFSRIGQLLVGSGAERGNTHSEHDTMGISSQPRPFDKTQNYCDRCIGSVLKDTACYTCETCHSDDFLLCIECFEGGLKCLDDSHELALTKS